MWDSVCQCVSEARPLGCFLSPHPRTSVLHAVEYCLLWTEFVFSPNSFVKALIPNMMVFEVGAFGSPPGRIMVIIRRGERACFLYSLQREGHREDGHLQTQQVLPGTSSVGTLIWTLSFEN
uniref:Uncharacterized protein n=1 Tax=Myotis myotis TaxID=51298 RepID=A0A7J7U5N3_MYOMY|nr:hypothetical protein mMyoMyo1_008874 [Myotis myotis]